MEIKMDCPGFGPSFYSSVLTELGKIQASRAFRRCGCLCRLLRYLVEQSLRHPEAYVKEYAIGTGVFGKPETYDPRSDPVVRVEARRLRAKLSEYYRGEGSSDPVEITLPRRTYHPMIRARSAVEEALGSPLPGGTLRQAIALFPFRCLETGRDGAAFARGLEDELTDALMKHGVRIVSLSGSIPSVSRGAMPPVANAGRLATAMLCGSVRRHDSNVRISAQLIHAGDGSVVWTQVCERSMEDPIAAQRKIARVLAEGVSSSMAALTR